MDRNKQVAGCRQGNAVVDTVLLPQSPSRRGTVRRIGVRRMGSADPEPRTPGTADSRNRGLPEPVALPRWRCPVAPTGPGTAGPALAPGFLFFGLFLPVSVFIAPIF